MKKGMVNQSGFYGKPVDKKMKPESGLGGMSAGPGALGGAKKKTDPMHRKPRKNPSSAGVSTKG